MFFSHTKTIHAYNPAQLYVFDNRHTVNWSHFVLYVIELDEVIAKAGNILLTQLEIKSF